MKPSLLPIRKSKPRKLMPPSDGVAVENKCQAGNLPAASLNILHLQKYDANQGFCERLSASGQWSKIFAFEWSRRQFLLGYCALFFLLKGTPDDTGY